MKTRLALYGKIPAQAPDKSHPSYQQTRGMTMALASGGRKRQIKPQP